MKKLMFLVMGFVALSMTMASCHSKQNDSIECVEVETDSISTDSVVAQVDSVEFSVDSVEVVTE